MTSKTKPEPRDELDKWLDKNGYYQDTHSMPQGKHGKKVNGEFVGRRLNEAVEMGIEDDEYIEEKSYY